MGTSSETANSPQLLEHFDVPQSATVHMKPLTDVKSLLKNIQKLTKREARVLSSMAKKMAVSLRVSERASVLLNKIPTMKMKKLYWLARETFRSSSRRSRRSKQKQPWSNSSSRRNRPRIRKGKNKRRGAPKKLEEEEEEADDISTYSHSDEFIAHNADVLKKLLLQQLEDAKYLENNEKLLHKSRSSPTSESSALRATPPELSYSPDIQTTQSPAPSPANRRHRPSAKALLNRPWIIRMRTADDPGGAPTLQCYSVDDEGDMMQVHGQGVLPPPPPGSHSHPLQQLPTTTNSLWKPVRQTLRLREIPPTPCCPKHMHLQKPTRYELVRETLLQANILTSQADAGLGLTPESHQSTTLSLAGSSTEAPGSSLEPATEDIAEDAKSDNTSHVEHESGSSSGEDHAGGHEEEDSGEEEKREEEKKQLERGWRKLRERRRSLLQMEQNIQNTHTEKQRQMRNALTYANNQAALTSANAVRYGTGMTVFK